MMKKILLLTILALSIGLPVLAGFPVKPVRELSEIDRQLVRKICQKQLADGRFADVDYAATKGDNWKTAMHLWNLWYLTEGYLAPGEFYRSPAVRDAIVRGLYAWAAGDFQSDNWWHQQIGTPLRLGGILLALGDDAPPELRQKLKVIFDRAQLDPKSTGQNRIWMARVDLYKGILYRDRERAIRARDVIGETMVIAAPGQEGVQWDYAFHQHGPQLQFGNYGYSFLKGGIELAELLQGGVLAMPTEKSKLLADYYFYGPRWTIFREKLDLNACARYIGRDKQKWLSREFAQLDQKLRTLFPEREEWKNPPDGNRYFASTDFMVHRRKDYYLSLRMCSSRVVGSETVCNENMQGRLMGNGLLLAVRDQEEYRNFALFWNYRKLPGITALQDGSELLICPGCWKKEAFYNASPLVGALSDGRVGVAMQELKHGKFYARKSFFFFDRYYVGMGSGIAADSATTLNSCRKRGDIETTAADGSTGKNPASGMLKNLVRVRHDNMEYLFASPTDVELTCGVRTASWQAVVDYDNSPPVTDDVFALALPHPAENGSYLYAVRPVADDGSKADFQRLITSSPDIHAVCDRATGVVMIAFFEAGSVEVSKRGKMTVETPLLIMLQGNTLFFAEPTQQRKRARVTLGARQYDLSLPSCGRTGQVSIE